MYNILVTGSDGQLGSELRFLSNKYKSYKYFFTDKDELDICNINSLQKFVNNSKINVIVNCAAYTAVDKAETEPELAHKINFLGTKNLALIAKKNHCKLVHISTDYVFDGTKISAYNEEDNPNPQSVYGKTKLLGEKTLKIINPENCIIIRTSWVYSKFGNNFVKTMLRLGLDREEINVVVDQVGSPTYAFDLAQMILQIIPKIKNKKTTIFHYANDGFCSWADFATEIFKISNINCKVNPITTLDYPTPAKRPSFSVMNKSKIEEFFDLKIPRWKESLGRMLKFKQ
jgi:dTDP-4-dehydrorhamnose reductase